MNEKAIQQRQKQGTLLEFLKSDNFKSGIGEVLPKHLTPDRMVRVAIAAMTKTPLLQNCTKESFVSCMMELSQLGLEPDGRRAHLIPFRNKKKGTVECTLIVDYKGLVSLINKTGLVSKIHTDIVCENDQFVYNMGTIEKHVIDFKGDRGKPYAAYCIIKMKDGSQKCEVMTKDQIESIRKRSKSKDSGPWVTDYDQMALKTVFRRAAKWVSWDPEEITQEVDNVSRAFELDNKNFLTGPAPQDSPRNIEQLTTQLEAEETEQGPDTDDLGYGESMEGAEK